MMLLSIYKDGEGKRQENLYFSYDQYFRDTFSPATEIEAIINFKISGKTYQDKKESLIQIAKDFQYYDEGGLSYGELAEIYSFLEKNAKKYGCLREFKENCIL